MTRSSRAVSLAVVATLLAACGGASKPAKPPTVAAADKAAAAILLKADDLPSGYSGATHDSSGDDDATNKDFAACLGASAPNTGSIKDTYSDDFTKGEAPISTQISSEVDVVKDASVAVSDVKAFTSSKAVPCLETFVSKTLAEGAGPTSGVSFGNPKVDKVDVSTDGIDSAFGYTVAVSATAQGQTIPFEVIFIGLLKKHTKISFSAVSLGQTLSATDRDNLVRTLRERTSKSAV